MSHWSDGVRWRTGSMRFDVALVRRGSMSHWSDGGSMVSGFDGVWVRRGTMVSGFDGWLRVRYHRAHREFDGIAFDGWSRVRRHHEFDGITSSMVSSSTREPYPSSLGPSWAVFYVPARDNDCPGIALIVAPTMLLPSGPTSWGLAIITRKV